MKRKGVLAGFVVLALILVVAVVTGCGGTTTTTAGGTTTSGATTTTEATTTTAAAINVKIAAQGPFTGNLSKVGLDALQAVQFAVDDFNKSGAMPGVTFAVEVADDAADPAVASNVAQKLADDKAVVAVVGPMNSSTVLAALPIFDAANLCMISQSATNPALAQKGAKVFHRICPSDDIQGPSIAKFMVEDLGVKAAYLIDDKSTYGKGLADQVEAGLKERGVTNIQRSQISADDKDFSSVLTKVKAANPDILFFGIPSPAQAAAIAKQARAMGMNIKMMGGEGMGDEQEFIVGAQGATEGAYCTSFGPLVTELPTAKEFLDRYTAKYGATSIYTAASYECTMLLFEAIKSVGVKDGKIDRAAVNDAVSKIKYKGILGFEISFTPEGNLATGGIFILQVKDNKFTQVKQVVLP